jgi:hypothetical protein
MGKTFMKQLNILVISGGVALYPSVIVAIAGVVIVAIVFRRKRGLKRG